MGDISLWQKLRNCGVWLPSYGWQRLTRRSWDGPTHLIIALADHFEPSIAHPPARFASRAEGQRRVAWWCNQYPGFADPFRDSDGFPFRHTYFWPAEQYDRELLKAVAMHCHEGWGEIEIHLHHGVESPDNSRNTRKVLSEFRDRLAGDHGCLSFQDGSSMPRYAFVHGNFALANSAGGRNCGVDDELQILAETGCYADLTLPSAPNRSQVSKINSLYECQRTLNHRAAHATGRDLRTGSPPTRFPLIFQGPLLLAKEPETGRIYIENSAVAKGMEPNRHRLALWRRANIAVQGRPEWIFIKLHCHGLDPNDRDVMMGEKLQAFLRFTTEAACNGEFGLHFVTAREMVNIALASCEGCSGQPGDYRDYRFRLITTPKRASLAERVRG